MHFSSVNMITVITCNYVSSSLGVLLGRGGGGERGFVIKWGGGEDVVSPLFTSLVLFSRDA